MVRLELDFQLVRVMHSTQLFGSAPDSMRKKPSAEAGY